jgi:hypothetical protein
LLSNPAKADPDSNGFVATSLDYSHDLASQGDRVDAQVDAYGALYNVHHEIDTGAIEARLGPVFNLERFSIAHSTLGIYAIGGDMMLEAQPYRYTLGAGALVTSNFDPQTQAHLRFEYRYEQFSNSDDRPTVSDMTGGRERVTADVERMVTDWLSLSALIYGERKDAVQEFDADWEAGATVDATLRFPGPFTDPSRRWALDLSAGIIERQFDAPDTTMSTDSRHDDEGDLQSSLTIPVNKSLSAVGTVGYRKVLSNYTLYTLDDISTSLALMEQF